MLLKRTVYAELVKNVNAIDTSIFVKKTNDNTKTIEIKGKAPSITGLVTTADLNPKIN